MAAMAAGRIAGCGLVLLFASICGVWAQRTHREPVAAPSAEFHFIRTEYVDLYRSRGGFGRGWWM